MARKHNCYSSLKRLWMASIRTKSDSDLLDSIANKNGWYRHDMPDHRLYMRLEKQEAHKRGLGT